MRERNKSSRRPKDFGHKVWASSLVFIDHLLEKQFHLEKQSVLEVGCGWGLVGLFLGLKYKCNVILTDKDKNVLPVVKGHAELNHLKAIVKPMAFADIPDTLLQNCNILLGVEVCYSDSAAKELLSLVQRAFKFKVDQIFITDPGRPGFLEYFCENTLPYEKNLTQLAGTVNGKTTYLLHLTL